MGVFAYDQITQFIKENKEFINFFCKSNMVEKN